MTTRADMSPLSLSLFGARIAGSGCTVGLPHGMLCPRADVAGPRAIDLRGVATDDDDDEEEEEEKEEEEGEENEDALAGFDDEEEEDEETTTKNSSLIEHDHPIER